MPNCGRCEHKHQRATRATLQVYLAGGNVTPQPAPKHSGSLCQSCYTELVSETPGLATFGLRWEAHPCCSVCGNEFKEGAEGAPRSDDGQGGLWCASCIPF